MLVVVLIIGVLAGIALPQYTKTVEKTRLAEALLTASSLQKAIDVYILTNGLPGYKGEIRFLSDNPDVSLDLDIMQNLTCDKDECSSENFVYFSRCYETSCSIEVRRVPRDTKYTLWFYYSPTDGWGKDCEYINDDKFEYICKYLESQGFNNIGRGEC